MRPLSALVMYSALGWKKTSLNFLHTLPTVGVYMMGKSSSWCSTRTR